jgi:hypothetical protein
MSDERRYDEAETAYILERASADTHTDASRALAAGDGGEAGPRGLSLRQLRAVAAESGISADAVERAAAAVRRGDLVPTRRAMYAGLPVGVSRTIEFAHPVSDETWDRLVVLLRETFSARGRVSRHGTLREWNNGNLVALLEPTPQGHRLRLSTRKGNAGGLIGLGSFSLVTSAAVSVPLWLASGGVAPTAWWAPAVLALVGVANLGGMAWTLPRWARTRAAQMEALAERATQLVEEQEPGS